MVMMAVVIVMAMVTTMLVLAVLMMVETMTAAMKIRGKQGLIRLFPTHPGLFYLLNCLYA